MKKFINFLIIILIFASFFYIYARFIEPNLLNIHFQNIKNEYTINDKELKILQFSDMHYSEYFNDKDVNKAVERINDEAPDIVVFTGDLIDEYNNYENKEDVYNIWKTLKKINAPLGKYAIYGNHDYGGGAEKIYKKIMEDSGFIILKNELVRIEEYNVNIVGMDDSIFGEREINKVVDLLDENSFNIVLSHEPDVVDYLLEYNIDLFLSGHSHGGQVNLPFINSLPLLAEKYTGGIYCFNNYRQTLLYVNVGLGTSQMPMRFMAPPELSVFVLE